MQGSFSPGNIDSEIRLRRRNEFWLPMRPKEYLSNCWGSRENFFSLKELLNGHHGRMFRALMNLLDFSTNCFTGITAMELTDRNWTNWPVRIKHDQTSTVLN